MVATGSILNYGLNFLDHAHGLRGWQWMFIVQGAISMFFGLLTLLWIPDFPEQAAVKTWWFLSPGEADQVLAAIDRDRQDAGPPEPFTTAAVLTPFLDAKLYAFGLVFFLQNVVSTALSYFIPTILAGMGFTSGDAILLYAPPYYWAVVPVVATSFLADRLTLRGPVIVFNALCLIAGMCMLGFPRNVAVRYVGVMLATGAYVSNWAAMNAWQMNNITGQCTLDPCARGRNTSANGLLTTNTMCYREASHSRSSRQRVQRPRGRRRLVHLPAGRSTMVPDCHLGRHRQPHLDHRHRGRLWRLVLAGQPAGPGRQGGH